jgi:HigB_toxin, RelE-like toxic component of a toxin-antitoxin system
MPVSSPNNRIVFNIKGNDYRLVIAMRYDKGIGFVRFIGSMPITTLLMQKAFRGGNHGH